MSGRAGNWIIGTGAILMFLGFCCLPGALGDGKGADLMQFAVGLFSLGALAIAAGMYLKAWMLKAAASGADAKKEDQNANRRIRGGCQLCATEAPVIQCKIHQLHLCGNCLAQHYDVRSCIYVPTTRAVAGKSGRNPAARARGA